MAQRYTGASELFRSMYVMSNFHKGIYEKDSGKGGMHFIHGPGLRHQTVSVLVGVGQ